MNAINKTPFELQQEGRLIKPAGPIQKYRPLLVLFSSVVLLCGGAYFLVSDTSGLEYYKHVDEVTKNLVSFQNQPMQIHGFVTPGSIQKSIDAEKKQVLYQFEVENCGEKLPAVFSGITPDTFKDGAEVVLKGRIRLSSLANHTLEPKVEVKEVLGKCPSKYSQDEQHLKERELRCIRETRGTEVVQEKQSYMETFSDSTKSNQEPGNPLMIPPQPVRMSFE